MDLDIQVQGEGAMFWKEGGYVFEGGGLGLERLVVLVNTSVCVCVCVRVCAVVEVAFSCVQYVKYTHACTWAYMCAAASVLASLICSRVEGLGFRV